MGPAVYDSRIRPSGINQTGKYKEIHRMDEAAAFENLINNWVYSTEKNITKLLLGIKEDILFIQVSLFSRWSYLCLCKCLCSKFLSHQRCQNGMFSFFYSIKKLPRLIAMIPRDLGLFNVKWKLYFTLKLLFPRENYSDPSSTTWKQFRKSINCTICKRGEHGLSVPKYQRLID